MADILKINGIIHVAATGAALTGAGLAQLPGADMPIIISLQTGMITLIAQEHSITLTKTAAADLLLTFAAAVGGRALSQWLVGWIPVWGNTINATTAATLTETIGWMAHAYFAKENPSQG
jgi:uncharacterized protein (DUF697 family)